MYLHNTSMRRPVVPFHGYFSSSAIMLDDHIAYEIIKLTLDNYIVDAFWLFDCWIVPLKSAPPFYRTPVMTEQ